jgi:hypothetical protein
MDEWSISFDVPEQLGWEVLGLFWGDDDGRLVADLRRDLADRDRWDDGGQILPPLEWGSERW